MMTRWIEPTPLATSFPLPNLHPLVGQALLKRGFEDPQAAAEFLDPRAVQPPSPYQLPGMETAVERILAAIRSAEQICIWGDFDLDGQTSTTVLVESLRAMGARVSYHIPIRQLESHGVNMENLARIIATGVTLVVTCDTGISAVKEVEYAKSRGVDMVITDHHDLPAELPRAIALVNPKMLPASHPLASLAGVGVAYKLAEALLEQARPEDYQLTSLLDLAALGLVADLAILRGESRRLVSLGLAQLRARQRLGLKIMMELAELSSTHLTEEHIGFGLAPRLNALGRLGDANPAVELLTTSDPIRARVLASQLEGLNAERKMRCDQVYLAAEAQLAANPELLSQPAIVLFQPLWPGGIVGIVASRIVERYHKPAILLSAPDGQALRGSARSVDGVNITAAIAAQQDLLLGFGGHPMAAGLALPPENLAEFRKRLGRNISEQLGEAGTQEAQIEIDGWIDLPDAGLELAETLECLAPFGPGNPKLTLACRNLTLVTSTGLGKNKEHLKLTVHDENGTQAQVLWWDGGGTQLPEGKFDLALSLRASDWRGLRQAQLELIDFRLVEANGVDLRSKPLEVLDYRTKANPLSLLAQPDPEMVCWAEADDKKRTAGLDRTELHPAKTLLLWTAPASRQDLLQALHTVRPERVLVVALTPGFDEPRTFLERLAGLAKFTLSKKDGKTSLSQLAVATGQTTAVIRLGLDYFSKQGQLTAGIESDGSLNLAPGSGPDQKTNEAALEQLTAALAETRAYRKLFRERAIIDLS